MFTTWRPSAAIVLILALASLSAADTVIFDFGDGAQGWTSTGPITTDFGEQAYGVVGKGRAHVGDFSLAGWGMTDYSPVVDLSAYTGLRVYARLRDVYSYPPFAGTPTLYVGLAIGDAEWMGQGTLTSMYQAFGFDFDDLVPDGTYATAPITPAQLADPNLVIKMKMYQAGNSGVGALDYDQVVALGPGGETTIQPNTIIYDFDDYANACYPDGWGFFGYPQTDFGADTNAEDGHGAYQKADWTGCDYAGYPRCDFVGSKVGGGVMSHPHCTPGGYDDIHLDLSLGTSISVRAKDDITSGYGGTLGAELQFQLVDADGTTAVTTRWVVGKEWIVRSQPLIDDWYTYTFNFKSLDYAWDNGSSASGTESGLNLNHILAIKLLWRRDTAEGVNTLRFDEVTLLDDPVFKWGDADQDGDIDVPDFAEYQVCFGTMSGTCEPFDADYDTDIDFDDFQTWRDCFRGPDIVDGGYPWCY